MTVRELIKELLDCSLDALVYVGRGMGPIDVVREQPSIINEGKPVVVTVRELIKELLDCSLDALVYVGRGMGPIDVVREQPSIINEGKPVVVIEP